MSEVNLCAQIRLRRLQRQMVMIAHDAEGTQYPARALARLEEAFPERAPGSLLFKNVAAVVAAVDHMVYRSRIFESKRTRQNKTTRT